MSMPRILLTLLACALAACPAYAAGQRPLRVSGPAIAETLPLVIMAGRNPAIELIPWSSPDQLRALVATKAVDAALMTTATACTLRNRGIPAVVVGLFSSPLWIVSADDSPDTLQGLQDQEILLPFGAGEMPDLILQTLAGESGLRYRARHAGNAMEAVNLLLLGKARHAFLSEPAASLAVLRGARLEARPRKRLDFRETWRDVFPEHPDLCLSALVAVGEASSDPGLRVMLRSAYAEAHAWGADHPEAMKALVKDTFPALWPQIRNEPAPLTAVRILRGPQAEGSARFLLERLHGLSPASIGGALPPQGFFEVRP